MLRLTEKDIYDALWDQLGGKGSCHYIDECLDHGLGNVTVDGAVDCAAIADFLNKKLNLD
jgi:hypothetical protein